MIYNVKVGRQIYWKVKTMLSYHYFKHTVHSFEVH